MNVDDGVTVAVAAVAKIPQGIEAVNVYENMIAFVF